jgi:ADP-heptose:LPS heptosyltransferase
MSRPSKHKRILVVRTDRIGDVVLATPLLRTLRQTFPSAYIAVMVRPYTAAILQHNPWINEIILDDPAGVHTGRGGFWRQVKELRKRRFDTALMLLPTERAAWMLFWAGIRTRIGVGHKLYEFLTFMRTVSRHRYIPLRHEADYCLDLGRAIGADSNNLTTEIFLTREERTRAAHVLKTLGVDPSGMIIGIHPGSGHSSPNWTIDNYRSFAAELLRRYDATIIVSGTENDLLDTFHVSVNRNIIRLPELPLREFIGVISHYTFFFSSSTGPMHIAAAVKIPTLSLFCPLPACSPQLWGPRGNTAQIIVAPDTVCQMTCEKDPHLCMLQDVNVDTVVDQFDSLYRRIRQGR